MQKRHSDRALYFQEQIYTTEKYVIPFIERHKKITADVSVLEIGCGEGGNMKPFLDKGCLVTGIDLSEGKIAAAEDLFANHPLRRNLTFICEDIYKVTHLNQQFDIVILRDVIEHIPDQERFLPFIRRFLKNDGCVFFAFPPWYNPFGGHQQICKNKYISHTPYIHLLPNFLYRKCLQVAGENVEEMLEIKSTGISLERFFRIVKKGGYRIDEAILYFINPNYEIKFGLKPRKLAGLANIPYLRNFWTTCGYFMLSNKNKEDVIQK
ncbi:class I SAM-dependent methyltransferase [Parabacteroides pacaensis]|uniref:class I SAM-dependent methyltransferase n=1 Tax=Parabacteroides pacaensis TaxID=2086575 RepID=UPI000D0E4BAD|nr:class I SAM-dependent methyltransferase [Parabacteroides pacaensis]